MSGKPARSIYNTFEIDANYIDLHGSNYPDSDITFETHGTSKVKFQSDTEIVEGKKLLISSVCDKTGAEIFSKDNTNNRIKFNIPIDFNNQAPVNFSGGGGGGATTTSGIQSENLAGQTLEDELDALTTQQNTNTNNIATNTLASSSNTTNIATLTTQQNTNTNNIATNTANIATNTTGITNLNTQQLTNTNNIASNTTTLTSVQTLAGTNATNITALQTQQATNTADIATNATGIGTALTNATNALNASTTNATNIATNTTNITTNTGNITALTTQQNLNTAAIASNTARTSNLTADRVLISSAVGTINTAGVGITDLATQNSGNTFNAPLGNPATQNSFDTITASTITNTGTTESVGYTQGGNPLNFSHLAGSVDKTDLPTEAVRTDLPDQTIQGNASSSSLTKVTIDNTHATGTSNFVIQKRSTGGVLEGGLTIQQTTTGTNITGQAPAGQNPDISITPANGSLAMTIGGLESRFHNNLKIIGSMSGAARSDQKDYIFKTLGATGTGDVLLLEDVIQRPTTGAPAAGFNPTNNSFIQIDSAGVPTYKETSNFLSKPSLANPSVRSFVAVETGGTFSYVPSSFLPLPGGLLPTSGENIIFVNPGGPSAYVDRANIIERPGAANPTSGTKLITINNVGTRAYKDLGQFLTTPGNANPSSDSFIKISSTGVQSYVAESSLGGGGIQKPGGSNPGQQSLISLDTAGTETYLAESNLLKNTTAAQTITTSTASASFNLVCSSTNIAHEASMKIERSGGVGDNFIEFRPKRGTFAEWECKNDLRILINGQTKLGVGNHTVDFFKPLVMQNGFDIRMNQTFTAPANSSSTGSAGTIGFDSTHLYIAVGTNSWKRVALSTF